MATKYLKDQHREFLALLFSGQITKDDVRSIFQKQFPDFVELSDRQLADFCRDYHHLVLEFKTNDKRSYEAATKFGLLNYGTRYLRIAALERVVDFALNGYQEDVIVAGQVRTITKKDLSVAVRALNAIKTESEQLSGQDSTTYQINIERAVPPQDIEDDEPDFT